MVKPLNWWGRRGGSPGRVQGADPLGRVELKFELCSFIKNASEFEFLKFDMLWTFPRLYLKSSFGDSLWLLKNHFMTILGSFRR